MNVGRKTADDLKPDPASIGGAMSQWPRRTLNWLCRDLRVNAADEFVAKALIDREVRDLQDLQKLAIEIDIDIKNLQLKKKSLDQNDALTILRVLENTYTSEYGEESMHNCPFEDSGMDKACWRCPVAGNALDQLEEMTDRQTELEAD